VVVAGKEPIGSKLERRLLEISSYAKIGQHVWYRLMEPDQGYSQGTLGGVSLGDLRVGQKIRNTLCLRDYE
jgi:hypothetical protein